MTATARGSILVGVDFSEASAGAISLAGALATALGASSRPSMRGARGPALLHARAARCAGAAAPRGPRRGHRLPRAVRSERSNVSARGILVDEPPVEALLRLSASADILVLGTHGRRGPSRWWLGSVAERVFGPRRCRFWWLRGRRAELALGRFRRLLVARAHDAPAANADALAHRIGTAFGGTIEVGEPSIPANAARSRRRRCWSLPSRRHEPTGPSGTWSRT